MRTKYFTRTIKSKDVLAIVIDPNTHELNECVVNVPDGADVKKYVEATTAQVLVNVVEETDVENIYKMDLNTFLANATKVENNLEEN